MVWLQPKDLSFTTNKYQTGGMLDLKLKFAINKIIFPYFQINAKTKGWVIGNVFQDKNISYKFGMSFYFK